MFTSYCKNDACEEWPDLEQTALGNEINKTVFNQLPAKRPHKSQIKSTSLKKKWERVVVDVKYSSGDATNNNNYNKASNINQEDKENRNSSEDKRNSNQNMQLNQRERRHQFSNGVRGRYDGKFRGNNRRNRKYSKPNAAESNVRQGQHPGYIDGSGVNYPTGVPLLMSITNNGYSDLTPTEGDGSHGYSNIQNHAGVGGSGGIMFTSNAPMQSTLQTNQSYRQPISHHQRQIFTDRLTNTIQSHVAGSVQDQLTSCSSLFQSPSVPNVVSIHAAAIANAGLLTTVSAGAIYNNQIMFVPASTANPKSCSQTIAEAIRPKLSVSEDKLRQGAARPNLYHLDGSSKMLMAQIEYYFSENNLLHDTYLRGKMDCEGWVELVVIAAFKRIVHLNYDVDTIAQILTKSERLEVDGEGLKVRLRENPSKWVLPSPLTAVGSTSIVLNPHAPEFIPSAEVLDEVSSQDDSAFLSAPPSTAPSSSTSARRPSKLSHGGLSKANISSQERHRLALQARRMAPSSSARRLPSSCSNLSDGEDDVDDNMLSYLVIIHPESPDMTSPQPPATEGEDIGQYPSHRPLHRSAPGQRSSCSSSSGILQGGMGAAATRSHGFQGDRQPNFQTRSKLNSELEEMIKIGLEEYEKEFRNNETSNCDLGDVGGAAPTNSSTSQPADEDHFSLPTEAAPGPSPVTFRTRTGSSSDSKVNVISREEFDLLSQSLSHSHLRDVPRNPPPPPPPTKVIGPHLPNVPSLIGIPTATPPLYPPGSYMYFPPAAAGHPAHLSLIPQVPLSISICTLAHNSTTQEPLDHPQPLKSILRRQKKHLQQLHSSARQIVGFFPAGSDRYSPHNKHRTRLYSEGENMQCETHVGFAFDTKSRSRTASASSDTECSRDKSLGTAGGGSGGSFGGLKNHKSHAILRSHGFTVQGYAKFRSYALRDREINGIGLSQEMNTMYRFWSFFLRENFNKSMFNEFRRLAFEDANTGARYGLECLFRFYSYGLESRLRGGLLRYFQEDTLTDYYKYRHKYGLEKFWAFLHYSGRRVELQERLQVLLQKYRTLDDLRADFIPPDGFFIDRTKANRPPSTSSSTVTTKA